MLVVEDVPAIEDEGRLHHGIVHGLVVDRLERVPLGEDDDGVGAPGSLHRVLHDGDGLIVRHRPGLRAGMIPFEFWHGQIQSHLLLGHLRVVYAEVAPVRHEPAAHVDGRGLPGVAGVFLERKAVDSDLFPFDGVEHRGDDSLHEPLLLVVVHGDHRLPVVGDILETHALADVHQVQNVLLEARSPEPDAGVQELGADTGVGSDRLGHLLDVGPGGLAEGGDRVDRGYPLGKHGVGRELRQLGRPQVRLQDAFLRDPVGVHGRQHLDCLRPPAGVFSTYEHTVWTAEIADGGSLGQELRVRQNVKLDRRVRAVALQDLFNGLGRLDGNRRLLDDNLGRLGYCRDHSGGSLPIREVGRLTGTDSASLRGGVHAHEDDVCLRYVLLHLGGKKQIATPGCLHDLLKPRLVDRKGWRVPGRDPALVDVEHHDLNLRALEGNHGHCRATHIPSSDACDLHSVSCGEESGV
mmetsp:Transcript_3739/g.10714  ORF Transcript_3739/g.10714 Transcript_3739/m.10714 type:complete len:465 (-) Transcript_3739:208-1602(-)